MRRAPHGRQAGLAAARRAAAGRRAIAWLQLRAPRAACFQSLLSPCPADAGPTDAASGHSARSAD
ncbi:hypothetical protein QR66_13110 [Chromobacterium piscinae]|nr:hypothetical protein QR66_13110 [Chromobacterium piscinae]